MKINEIISSIKDGAYDAKLIDIYVDENKIAYQRERYQKALEAFKTCYGDSDVSIYSAPGRSEIGGNHTDHQHGEVLAASVNSDAIAVVEKIDEPWVYVISHGFEQIKVSLGNLEKIDEEEESTAALIRGVLFKIKENGHAVGGFKAYITSDVLIGSGLSSSAAFETLLGTIVSGEYNGGEITAVEIAQIGQFAENVYFGKPSGLMDQMACSVGSLVHIDFADTDKPEVESVKFDFDAYGYSLCITDTKGSHADLTSDYAAIPTEMKSVANLFGREVLGDTSKEFVLENTAKIRENCGDRAFLRAFHYACENERVEKEVEALKTNKLSEFFDLVKKSGNSSYKYLQNVYTSKDVVHQNLSVALAVSEVVLGEEGASRVHGGGFAGTIQAFVPNNLVADYKKALDAVFGDNSCTVMKIRKYGGIKVI